MNTEHIKEILSKKHSYQIEFHEAVLEIYKDIVEFGNRDLFEVDSFFERIIEPDRTIRFKVEWRDCKGDVNVNAGYRVQFNNALGPYKGGLRFHPTVNESIVKFLGFEQIFKNALTGLPMGGGKGGADFDPKGKSEAEIHNFCVSFMTELNRYIDEGIDVPAGDIGVGGNEIAYMYGQLLKMSSRHQGVLTGKNPLFGGVEGRKQATGYGLIYILEAACKEHDMDLSELRVLVSGSGNVALHACEKLIEKDVKVLTVSDSGGVLYFKDGMKSKDLEIIKKMKNVQKKRLSDFDGDHADFVSNEVPWKYNAEIALPCATQGELSSTHLETLIGNGLKVVAEGANKPLTAGAGELIADSKLVYIPGKAANAGGVAVSGLEIAQNSKRETTSFKKIDSSLKEIMNDIHKNCSERIDRNNGIIPYSVGANLYSFEKIYNANIMLWGK